MTEYDKIKGLFITKPIPEIYLFLTSGKGSSLCEESLEQFSLFPESLSNPKDIYKYSFEKSVEQKLLLPLEFLS